MNAEQYVECDNFRNLDFQGAICSSYYYDTRLAGHSHKQNHSRSGSQWGQSTCKSPSYSVVTLFTDQLWQG